VGLETVKDVIADLNKLWLVCGLTILIADLVSK
jgi:hypothetical protein